MAKQNPGEGAGRRRRVITWLTWRALLLSLWVAVDDSLAPDELLVGARVAALAALLAELVSEQSYPCSAVLTERVHPVPSSSVIPPTRPAAVS